MAWTSTIQLVPDVFSAAYLVVECSAGIGAKNICVALTSDGFGVELRMFGIHTQMESARTEFNSCMQRIRARCATLTILVHDGHRELRINDKILNANVITRSNTVKIGVSGWEKNGLYALRAA